MSCFILMPTVAWADSIDVKRDTLIYADTISNTSQPFTNSRKDNWLKRAYNFADRLLSPPRDSTYIHIQDEYNWCAELQFTSTFHTFDITSDTGVEIRVAPENRHRIGPFFGWRWAFLGYNFDIRSLFVNDNEIDLGGSVYSAAFGLDLFYRRIGGNYKIKKAKYEGEDFTNLLRNVSFDGLKVGMTRISFYYVPNYAHYSHQAAFSQTNRQLKSAGSLMLGGSYAHNRVLIDWNKIQELSSQAGVIYTPNTITRSMKNDEYSFMAGYGYNWVFAKNWLAASEFQGHLGYLVHHNDVSEKEPNISKPDDNLFSKIDQFYRKNIAFNSSLRLAVLYNNGPWFTGTQAVAHYYQYGNGNITTRAVYGTWYLFVGYNF